MVMLTDHLDMTIVVDWDVKPQNGRNRIHGQPAEKRDLMTNSENLKIMYTFKNSISVEQFLKISMLHHKR